MKLLLVIVSVIVVFNVDCREFPDKSKEDDPSNESQIITDGFEGSNQFPEEVSQMKGRQDNEFNVGNQELMKEFLTKTEIQIQNLEEKEHLESKLRRSRCKARNACVVMGGFCVTNATLCEARLVPEGCKGINCQCCVPDTLETKIHGLENELSSLKDSLNQASSNMTIKLQSMDSKLDSIQVYEGCSLGLFRAPGSRQCFKFLNVTSRSYTSAKTQCQTEGMKLAKPYNILAVRKYLVEELGSTGWVWLGARGAGSYFRWDRDGQQISNSNPLWRPGSPGSQLSTTYCVELAAHSSSMQSYPTQPIRPYSCSYAQKALCEMVME